MAIAFTPKKWEYILKADRKLPKENQTIFHLRTLSAREMADVEDSATVSISQKDIQLIRGTAKDPGAKDGDGDGEKKDENPTMKMSMQRGGMALCVLRFGLERWDNFKDAEGKQVPFAEKEHGMCAWANIDIIEADDRHEIAEAIESGIEVTEEEVKN